jgi:hypothetical protein
MLGLLKKAEFNWIWVTWSSGWSLKDLSGYHGTTKEKYDAMFVAYRKHFTNRHSHEDASQAAASLRAVHPRIR